MTWSLAGGLALALAAASPTARAQPVEPMAEEAPEEALDAEARVQRVNQRDVGQWSTRHLTMELSARNGSVRTREAMLFHRFFGEEKRLALFYLEPVTIRDTAFLAWDHPEGRDMQWLYLPAMRKTRRISTSDRGDYFLGTDLSYEDVKKEMKISESDYSFSDQGVEECGEQSCAVVEGTPVSPRIARELGYGRVRWWIDESNWMVRRVAYWDPGGRELKRSEIGEIRQVEGIWVAHRIEVENLQRGHRTVFLMTQVDFIREVPAGLFERNSLSRGWRGMLPRTGD